MSDAVFYGQTRCYIGREYNLGEHPMFHRILPALCVVSACLFAIPSGADTLLMENLNSERVTAAQRPARGLTMDRVLDVWGKPQTQHAPVGDPPITRWDYPDFSVFFEYSRVIHSVSTK